MKQLLLICAIVAEGCASTSANSWQQEKTNATVTPKPEPPKTDSKKESAKIIEKAIRKSLKKPAGELTKSDLEKVTRLDLFDIQLTDLEGLEKLTRLTELGLGSNQLTDLKGLEKLTKLETLYLEDNQLTSVKGLEKLMKLTRLDLVNNQLTSVKGGGEAHEVKETVPL